MPDITNLDYEIARANMISDAFERIVRAVTGHELNASLTWAEEADLVIDEVCRLRATRENIDA
jgi:hypothetical protein